LNTPEAALRCAAFYVSRFLSADYFDTNTPHRYAIDTSFISLAIDAALPDTSTR
jgi:hypothetical protein